MKIIRPILYLVLALVVAFLLFLAYAYIDDYKPAEITALDVDGQPSTLSDTAVLSLLIWNIGYAGLDASMDFFYDGGEQMRPSSEGVGRNIAGIKATLSAYLGYDFILLQEVDHDSNRSYHINQVNKISAQFGEYHLAFGKNYDVFFVPIPPTEPMGKVESGLMTLSKYTPAAVDRHSFPGNYSWPMKLFMLDRCFLVNHYPLSNQKELIVINTHNSAYDDGSLRTQQMSYLKNFLQSEYEKGNYVIVGGDWNQTPYGFEPELPSHRFDTENLTYVEKDYLPGWIWAYDTLQPTNRRVAAPYDKETSLTTVIDYYLLSPNIELEAVLTRDVNFQYSDHQPVEMKIRLSQ